MMNTISKTGFACFLLLVLTTCNPTHPIVDAPGTPEQPAPPVTGAQPTDPPDAQILVEAATLFRTDFENGFPSALHDWSRRWQIETGDDGNSILCNEISEDWSSFLFGLDDWENYAISLQMKFLSANEGQTAETYIRINESMDGYRASISNNEWAEIGYYPTPLQNNGSPVNINQDEWFQVQLHFVEDNLKFLINDEIVIVVNDDKRTSGRAGFGAGPNTEACVDEIHVWGLDESGNPIESPADLVIEPFDGKFSTIGEKIENKPTIPVFYPWSGSTEGKKCGQTSGFDFDCDTVDTPYSLLWTNSGAAKDIESTQPEVTQGQSIHMRSDGDTLYLFSEQWHYWYPEWRTLSSESIFYLDEVYGFHENSEYGHTLVINFEHPEWPDLMAEKALNFKNAGFDGMILDWWNNGAGNGRSEADVEVARLAISKAIREKVGDDFILMGNVNGRINDPTAQYLSGVFLELWKPIPSKGYALTYSEENSNTLWNPSIERWEALLIYWDTHLGWPRIICFEPWKITTGNYIEDRYTEENIQYAKLFTAMGIVIPENGYILYADNNDDWDGGDHQHAYYDFYHTDFGKATSGMVQVVEGVAYKQFETGLIAYNRTASEVDVTLPNGKQFKIGPIEGLFLAEY